MFLFSSYPRWGFDLTSKNIIIRLKISTLNHEVKFWQSQSIKIELKLVSLHVFIVLHLNSEIELDDEIIGIYLPFLIQFCNI